MQEYGFNIAPGRQGLVPNTGFPPGADYASRMRNLRAAPYAARNPEWFTCPFEDDVTLDWPFPQVWRGENVTLLFGADSVSTLASDWTVTALAPKKANSRAEAATITEDGVWHVATFEDVWFGCNGTNLVFSVPAYDATLVAQGLTCTALCPHNDRLVLAGLAGAWFSGDRWARLFRRWRETQPQFAHDQMTWSDRWVVWGERFAGDKDVPFWPMLVALGVFGNDAFDAIEGELLARIERGELGFSSVRRIGAVQAMRSLQGTVRVYSTETVAALVPDGSGPGYRVMPSSLPGVAARGALSGDDQEHAWLTPDGHLMLAGPERGGDLDQAHRFTSPSAWVGSYDPVAREHWFATATSCYVLNQNGLGGPMDVRPTSLARCDGVLVGVGSGLDADNIAVEFYTHDLDMGYRGSKRVQCVEVAQDGLTGLEVDAVADGSTMGTVQANGYGVAFPVRSGNEFQIGVKGTSSVGAEYTVKRCTVRYQGEDRRFRRGATAAAENA